LCCRHLGREEILKVIGEVAGKGLKEMKEEKGVLRQAGMELLYRVGGLRGQEIV